MNKNDKLETLIPMDMLEYEAQSQIYNALNLQFLLKLVILPDCHTGYHLPIGAVALLEKVISPSYVGYDIGCGMCCVIAKGIKERDILHTQNVKDKIFEKILKNIPVGVGIERNRPLQYQQFKSSIENKDLDKKVNEKLYKQLGTLGAGNHFIEIGSNKDGDIAIVIHSGSRNIGHSIADYYMKLSNTFDKELPNGFLDSRKEYGLAYYDDMCFALDFALKNREIMMEEVLLILGLPTSLMDNMINENHNHAEFKDTYRVLHRKGATPAEKDVLGVIPGNMKTGTYITRGLGNEQYLSSASHGAGRKMSRKKAKNTIQLDTFKKQMQGITARVDKNVLDEAPDAYKDVSEVIRMQEGIVVEVIDHITPKINIKG